MRWAHHVAARCSARRSCVMARAGARAAHKVPFRFRCAQPDRESDSTLRGSASRVELHPALRALQRPALRRAGRAAPARPRCEAVREAARREAAHLAFGRDARECGRFGLLIVGSVKVLSDLCYEAQPLAARAPFADSLAQHGQRLRREPLRLRADELALRLRLRSACGDLEGDGEHKRQVLVQHGGPNLTINVLWPGDVAREAHKMEDPGQIEANRDLPPGAPSDVEPQRVRRAAIKVDSRLVWSVAAVDVVQAREPPRDGQEIDIREERDKHLDAQIEPVLVEVAPIINEDAVDLGHRP
eukprot:CAMPEP_0181201760 /NCGR_PEP_ID=MMETSP1096-20121128/18475_1 /TAXON_ID=156174 ORGANISM="Chrysochromulina ericina, Strain CCMP281" /NCGR_SAMPLE_ID=MMETSP1096 /ASSEMBLY_ACC=CAM_ASM_000453 /LENGTH=300 /DNA_ID=CAMNT_0023292217 /DNA_START=151 /DNA_END=1054 /DNA_ORIENTATION=-